jgi:hypothetical protein
LLKPELKQRFAGDLQLLAFLGSGECCSTGSASENPNGGSGSAACNSSDERTQPSTTDNFSSGFLSFPFALKLIGACQ